MPDAALGTHNFTAYEIGSSSPSIIPAPTTRDWMAETDQQFANRCLPMLIANQSGWIILNSVAFSAIWAGDDDIDSVSVSYGASHSPPLAGSYFGYGILTWSIPFVFRTPPGFNLLVRGPANSPKDGVFALEGIVESDWASSTFTMNWKITRPSTPISFEVNEPICMIVPQRRRELESFKPEIRSLDEDPELRRRYRAWESSREQFLRGLGSNDGNRQRTLWQRDYFRGRHVGDEHVRSEHQTRLRIRSFEPSPPDT